MAVALISFLLLTQACVVIKPFNKDAAAYFTDSNACELHDMGTVLRQFLSTSMDPQKCPALTEPDFPSLFNCQQWTLGGADAADDIRLQMVRGGTSSVGHGTGDMAVALISFLLLTQACVVIKPFNKDAAAYFTDSNACELHDMGTVLRQFLSTSMDPQKCPALTEPDFPSLFNCQQWTLGGADAADDIRLQMVRGGTSSVGHGTGDMAVALISFLLLTQFTGCQAACVFRKNIAEATSSVPGIFHQPPRLEPIGNHFLVTWTLPEATHKAISPVPLVYTVLERHSRSGMAWQQIGQTQRFSAMVSRRSTAKPRELHIVAVATSGIWAASAVIQVTWRLTNAAIELTGRLYTSEPEARFPIEPGCTYSVSVRQLGATGRSVAASEALFLDTSATDAAARLLLNAKGRCVRVEIDGGLLVRHCSFCGALRGIDHLQKMSALCTTLLTYSPKESLNIDKNKRFDVSESTVSRLWVTWLDFLHNKLRLVPTWMPPDLCDKYRPQAFLSKGFNTVDGILDCTEIFIETPSSFRVQSETYSLYKKHNTAKGLVVCSPNGFVTFVSDLAPGRLSDKALTNHCGILDKFTPGRSIMADRGFTIADECKTRSLGLNIPPFMGGRPQLSEKDEEETRRIASVRIHVERVITRVKTFRILSQIFPNSMAEQLNKVWHICALLSNFIDSPLLKTTPS
ncbi:hypothetical protein MTO96_050944 [Rhipicephalus appendiculatus]